MEQEVLDVVLAVARRYAGIAVRNYPWMDFDDVEQELRLAAWRTAARHDASQGKQLRSWVARRCWLTTIDLLRSQSPLTRNHYAALSEAERDRSYWPVPLEAVADIAHAEHRFEEIETRLTAAQVLQRTPAPHAALLREVFLDGVLMQDIAERDGVTPARISQRVRRAKQFAREAA